MVHCRWCRGFLRSAAAKRFKPSVAQPVLAKESRKGACTWTSHDFTKPNDHLGHLRLPWHVKSCLRSCCQKGSSSDKRSRPSLPIRFPDRSTTRSEEIQAQPAGHTAVATTPPSAKDCAPEGPISLPDKSSSSNHRSAP